MIARIASLENELYVASTESKNARQATEFCNKMMGAGAIRASESGELVIVD